MAAWRSVRGRSTWCSRELAVGLWTGVTRVALPLPLDGSGLPPPGGAGGRTCPRDCWAGDGRARPVVSAGPEGAPPTDHGCAGGAAVLAAPSARAAASVADFGDCGGPSAFSADFQDCANVCCVCACNGSWKPEGIITWKLPSSHQVCLLGFLWSVLLSSV